MIFTYINRARIFLRTVQTSVDRLRQCTEVFIFSHWFLSIYCHCFPYCKRTPAMHIFASVTWSDWHKPVSSSLRKTLPFMTTSSMLAYSIEGGGARQEATRGHYSHRQSWSGSPELWRRFFRTWAGWISWSMRGRSMGHYFALTSKVFYWHSSLLYMVADHQLYLAIFHATLMAG